MVVSRRGCRAFYSKPLVRRSLEIELAIATSAAAIKAEEIRSSERLLKIRQVKRESERGWAVGLAKGWGAAGGCRGLQGAAPSCPITTAPQGRRLVAKIRGKSKFASTCMGNDLGIPLILRRSY